jgi:hypothetical protein
MLLVGIPGQRRLASRQPAASPMVFVLFHQRLCGPHANSLFNRRPNPSFQPDSKLEAAVHKADDSLQKVIELLEVA